MSDWDLKKAIGTKMAPYEETISNDRLILYALGLGFQKDPMYKDHYNFTYENADEFQSFPTMAVVVAHKLSLGALRIAGVPKFNPMMLLHGEESCEMFKPIEPGMTVVMQETLLDLQDKKKATVMVIGTEGREKESGELVFKLTTNLFIRGIGGFGHKGTVKIAIPDAPTRAPDAEAEETTTPNQAFLYRLSGDYNPLHVDPQMSAMGGFKVPILHGLCTYGITAKAVFEKFHKEDPSLLKKINARFTGHVFPGETLVVQMWKDGKNIVVQTKTKERGTVVLKGVCELKPEAKL